MTENTGAVNVALNWDDEIENTGHEFELMPEGDYRFTVTAFTRGWYEPRRPDAKLSPCPQAEIEMTINWTNPQGQSRTNTLTYKLQLSQSVSWKIFQFFQSLGLLAEDTKQTKFPWNSIIGKSGIAAVVQNVSQSNGKTYNNIDKVYIPSAAPTVYANQTNTTADIPF
ncbi:hypothetical protein [Jonquetella anthropi]|uniref:hypothetical protein n=1 Tax=Jonquetella anthropi TaxID=428712 RepID=UPI0001B915D5|nr:hypothetical protein [Jonquetella anthropi]EEX48657.1 hypothetical protein GCWU000246_00683 [Jonquetella anthropi E3_33 E1]